MENHEYSFRAWHREKDYMYANVAVGVMEKILYSRGTPKKKGADWYVSEDLNDGIIIMQYISIKDDRRRKIFEGDVVKVGAQEKLGVVLWDNDSARYVIKFVDGGNTIDFSDKRSLRGLKVAGNVYENLELVGGEPRSNASVIDYDEDVIEVDEELELEE